MTRRPIIDANTLRRKGKLPAALVAKEAIEVASIEPVYVEFGARVRHLRETLGLSQLDIANRVGLTRTSICNLESGRQRIPLHFVERFARALGVAPAHLMKGMWS